MLACGDPVASYWTILGRWFLQLVLRDFGPDCDTWTLKTCQVTGGN